MTETGGLVPTHPLRWAACREGLPWSLGKTGVAPRGRPGPGGEERAPRGHLRPVLGGPVEGEVVVVVWANASTQIWPDFGGGMFKGLPTTTTRDTLLSRAGPHHGKCGKCSGNAFPAFPDHFPHFPSISRPFPAFPEHFPHPGKCGKCISRLSRNRLFADFFQKFENVFLKF